LFDICFRLISCLAYSSNPEDEGDMSLRKRLTFNRLHGVISQKIELYLYDVEWNNQYRV
jgi:hypothetical protein